MSDDARTDSSKASETTGLSRHVSVFLEDRSLWPIVFIFVVHVTLAGALVLISALRAGSLPARAVLAILLTLSVHAVARARRRRRAMIWIATLWGLSALTALAASHFGLL